MVLSAWVSRFQVSGAPESTSRPEVDGAEWDKRLHAKPASIVVLRNRGAASEQTWSSRVGTWVCDLSRVDRRRSAGFRSGFGLGPCQRSEREQILKPNGSKHRWENLLKRRDPLTTAFEDPAGCGGQQQHRRGHPQDTENPWADLGVVRYLSKLPGCISRLSRSLGQ